MPRSASFLHDEFESVRATFPALASHALVSSADWDVGPAGPDPWVCACGAIGEGTHDFAAHITSAVRGSEDGTPIYLHRILSSSEWGAYLRGKQSPDWRALLDAGQATAAPGPVDRDDEDDEEEGDLDGPCPWMCECHASGEDHASLYDHLVFVFDDYRSDGQAV
jgi:hypothetical protein